MSKDWTEQRTWVWKNRKSLTLSRFRDLTMKMSVRNWNIKWVTFAVFWTLIEKLPWWLNSNHEAIFFLLFLESKVLPIVLQQDLPLNLHLNPVFVYFCPFLITIKIQMCNKHRYWAWDSNLWLHEGRRKWIHWAMAAA